MVQPFLRLPFARQPLHGRANALKPTLTGNHGRS